MSVPGPVGDTAANFQIIQDTCSRGLAQQSECGVTVQFLPIGAAMTRFSSILSGTGSVEGATLGTANAALFGTVGDQRL